jgi:hypothetical protein
MIVLVCSVFLSQKGFLELPGCVSAKFPLLTMDKFEDRF